MSPVAILLKKDIWSYAFEQVCKLYGFAVVVAMLHSCLAYLTSLIPFTGALAWLM